MPADVVPGEDSSWFAEGSVYLHRDEQEPARVLVPPHGYQFLPKDPILVASSKPNYLKFTVSR